MSQYHKTIQELLEESQAQYFGKDTATMFYKNVFIPSFARDIVLFGLEHGAAVVDQYGLSVEDLATIVEMPLFKAEVKNLRILMDSGVLVTTQMKAAAALESGVEVLGSKLADPDIKPADAVKIMQELRSLATMTHTVVAKSSGRAEGDAQTTAAGMTINFSFGDPSQLPPLREPINVTPAQTVIEAEAVPINVEFEEE